MNKTIRETKQRNAISHAFAQHPTRALSPKEVLELAEAEVPNLGIATVYRNIKTMAEKGELDPVELPGQAPRYQPPANKKPHLFIDEMADRVFTIDPKLGDWQPTLPEGFRLDRVQVICFGHSASGKTHALADYATRHSV